jgi:hypothetical protein
MMESRGYFLAKAVKEPRLEDNEGTGGCVKA